jgi:parallel beta-helix repeat protein
MDKKHVFLIITLLIIESLFISNLPANQVITKIKDNHSHNLLQNDTNFIIDYRLNQNNIYYSISTNNSNSTFEYIIITSDDFVDSSFQVLISHKSNYMNATIVTLEDIISNPNFWVNGTYGDATNRSSGNPYIKNDTEVTANYSIFNDTTAKIRNFIRFAHQNWNAEYILLGGDVEIVPVRKLYVNISGWETSLLFDRSIEGWIPSDLYYGNLNGTWNKDFDEKFGEIGNNAIKDEADIYSEVFIGRAPIDGKHDIATFVNKVINFETTIKPKDIFIHQSNLTKSKGPDTILIPEECAKLIPDSYKIHKLYQKNEIINKEKWVESFKIPNKLVHLHIGNGYYFGPTESWYRLYYNEEVEEIFSNNDIGRLDNAFFPIHISISCLSGNFENVDCLAEELLLWSKGGPSACIFNSEVGCVKYDDSLAYSGEYIKQLFYELFVRETGNLGKINQFSKYYFVNISYTNPNYRWIIYETNLLGDPETPVFETRIKLQPQIIYVDDDFNSSTSGWNVTHFDKIQKGIKACSNYGIVYVNNGTYLENVVIDKTIKLIGENKYSTIIDGVNNENIVIIKSNSSEITNFTLLHNYSDENKKEFTGIFIPKDCWGNTISNNVIINNSKSGIIVNDSCRNIICNNTISSNGVGIILIKDINKIFANKTIITCTNKIEYNEISSNERYGIYIQNILNNYIYNNNFLNNDGGSGKDAFFRLSRNNEWNGNYWNEPLTEPKKIWGTFGPIFFHIKDYSDGFIFPKFLYLLILNIGIPIPDIDKNPAQKPYEIN